MLTNEIVLNVFADYLSQDKDYEVVQTSRCYTVMGWDNHQQDWNTVIPCPTPEILLDALLDAYADFLEMKLTDYERDLTATEKDEVIATCLELKQKCEKEAEGCSP